MNLDSYDWDFEGVPPWELKAGCERVPLWAPGKEQVNLLVGSPDNPRKTPMIQHGQWWLAPRSLPNGTVYAFEVEGNGPFPDPRTRVYVPGSELWVKTADIAALKRGSNWQPDGKLLGKVWYELHIGTFTAQGTLRAAIEKLPYLADLGVEVIELMPTAVFPGERGWGYDGVGLYALFTPYGTPEDLVAFIDEAHKLEIAVAQDLVLNHLGSSGNYLSQFAPYFSARHVTPWGDGYNLDGPDSEPVRDFLVGAAVALLADYGFDGLRLDAVHEIQDDSELHLLAELSQEVHDLADELGRPLTLVAESDLNDPLMVTAVDEGGYGMDGQWDDDIHHGIHVAFTGETQGYYEDFADPEALSKIYSQVFYHNGTFSSFRGKNWGAPVPADMERNRFFGFASNHDQVGNRALGDRPSEKLSPGLLAGQAALILASPFTPMLFQGEEWGSRSRFQFFTDYADEGIGKAVDEGRKREFASHDWDKIYGGEVEVPSPQALSTFLNSKLLWQELSEVEHKKMLAWYRHLIALRREGVFADFIALERQRKLLVLKAERAQVIVNLHRKPVNISEIVAHLPEGNYFSFTNGKLESAPQKISGEDTLLIIA
ncbi:malto-oligosyltrehalose trehalohydrolase [uncultured Varibaculum sp.]|uniref:malto-oligosyltrehalose trehalohydrolase n=1 Tax=uncultured Varibaculum sp. TaxID=413896 RepID=UPI0025935E0D|nr:malto-oligosyltrehalose trehalohydrolase [uncultured Varibaculum sp.]